MQAVAETRSAKLPLPQLTVSALQTPSQYIGSALAWRERNGCRGVVLDFKQSLGASIMGRATNASS